MKRFIFFFIAAMAMAGSLRAAPVGEADARLVADKFLATQSARFATHSGPSATRLAYAAEQGRFYVFERGTHGGFVVVAGDDRLPQVLAYGESGDFTAGTLPPAVRYWMDEMNRQIAYLQAHSDMAVHQPAKRAQAVGPLMTSRWNQGAPFNNYCPTYTDGYGNTARAVTGCVATATAQVMNYWQWPPVGRGSHSYYCNVADLTPTQLSADFSQSVYHWDLMLDEYDEGSSPESCDAVARLMADIGIASEMGYGSSSGTWEFDASTAMQRYFGYCNKHYWLYRDNYTAAEWDQLLADEIGLGRPVMYCGDTNDSGHAFVLDGVDTNGYFHVNWGWGGSCDGYFLVSVLAPSGKYNFKNRQRGLFGMVPETMADEVDDVLYVRGYTMPSYNTAPLGSSIMIETVYNAEGNMMDTTGYESWGSDKYYYSMIPFKMTLLDGEGAECCSATYRLMDYLDYLQPYSADICEFDLPRSLADGEYYLKVYCSADNGASYDRPLMDYSGKEMSLRMVVQDDTAHIKERFLYNTYGIESFVVPGGVSVDETFDVGVNLSYKMYWYEDQAEGPAGDVYLSLLKDDIEVATSPMYEVTMPINTAKTYTMQITAPAQGGLYELVLNDESGNHIMEMDGYLNHVGEVTAPIYILPMCQKLVEDFETITPNSSTSDKGVQGRFAAWNFIKSGVRAPGEGKCNGSNSVMMKKPSALYTSQPLCHNFFLAQATIFNPTGAAAKYTLEYSTDSCTTWHNVSTIDNLEAAEAPAKSKYVASWNLEQIASMPVQLRIVMTGGGSAATYLDDISFYYLDRTGDVNNDGAVNIADVNAVINMILTDKQNQVGDMNGDGAVNIADINALIAIILK